MARKIFFSFHYDHDAWRVSIVRNSNIVTNNFNRSTYLDHADWQSILKTGPTAIQRWIDNQLEGSTVTCVLIGAETNSRPWVDYEIKKSIERKNAILGIYIHNIKNQYGVTDYQGNNPFYKHRFGWDELNSLAPTYDWLLNDGYNNFNRWIEQAVNNFKSINHFRGS